jgi:predicted HAD superfamily Cof-like phosphohydrolase
MAEQKVYPSPIKLVEEFHRTYGQPIRTEPIFDIPERIMRVKLILEEASEYWEANKVNDLVEMADALADLVYVAAGAFLTHGLAWKDSFGQDETTPAPLLQKLHRQRGGKVRPHPTLAVMTRNYASKGLNDLAVSYQQAAMTEGTDPDLLRQRLTSIVSACYFAAFSLGIDLDEILEEVQRSNMSKLGEDGKPIYREDGKVLKGPNFFVPNITAVLEAQGWKHKK